LAVKRVVLAGLVRIVQLVTDDPDAARCPTCRVVSTSGKDWVLTRPRDLLSGYSSDPKWPAGQDLTGSSHSVGDHVSV
jgi:hypothetical protein